MVTGMAVVKRTTSLAWLAALAAGVNIGLNLLLIPVWGMHAAAATTVLASRSWSAALDPLAARLSRALRLVSHRADHRGGVRRRDGRLARGRPRDFESAGRAAAGLSSSSRWLAPARSPREIALARRRRKSAPALRRRVATKVPHDLTPATAGGSCGTRPAAASREPGLRARRLLPGFLGRDHFWWSLDGTAV